MGSPCRGAPRQGLMAPPSSEFPDLRVHHPGPRHADRLGAKCPGDPAIPVAVAIALHRPGLPAIAQPPEKAARFFIENGLDGAADVRAQPILDRVKAFVARK